ncbi:hypothetical protein [Leifsonia xyli]|uniref:hypothetical protein n=1 Tax=Leifsonia xyli TaxID=1575 RepID=UPI0002FAF50F|nr:hypothetical protein [Leifsonia xyli]
MRRDAGQRNPLIAAPVQHAASAEDLIAALEEAAEPAGHAATGAPAIPAVAPAAPESFSRRTARAAERAKGRGRPVRERLVATLSPAVATAAAALPSRKAARVAGPRRVSASQPAHPPSRTRRWSSKTVVVLALAAFFGTAALPAYATTGEGSAVGAARTALAVQTLAGGDTAAQLVSRDTLGISEAPQTLTSTTNSTVSPSVQALAIQLMGAVASGRLVGSTPNHLPEIANLAAGKAVPGCGVDYRVLQAISIALDHFAQAGVSDINRRCTGQIEGAGTESAHYTDGGGHALDFYLLNGSPLTGGDAKSIQLIKILDPLVPSGTGLGQIECRPSIRLGAFQPFSDSCDHLHIDFLKAQGATLRYG